MDVGGMIAADRDVEGVVEMMLDATTNYAHPQPLTGDSAGTRHSCQPAMADFKKSLSVTGA
jgi:hypothetical protein